MKDESRWTEGPEVSEANEGPNWERQMIHDLAMASFKEQRRARRWSVFFRSLAFLYVTLLIVLYLPPGFWSDLMEEGGEVSSTHTALVKVSGVIAEDSPANASAIVTGLRKAFEDRGTKGVILALNSPGGSPVQSGRVYDEILRLKEKYPDIPVYAVASDVCASGCYYIASAADHIYADKASMVGSIGVLMNGFGFVDTLEKLGVERRLVTAGDNKGLLDPFSPINDRQLQHVQGMVDQIHSQFITAVKDGRGDRLKDDPQLFSGLVWAGEEAVKLGLIDGLGSPGYVARELIEEKNIVNFTAKRDLVERLAERFGGAAANAFVRPAELY